MKKIKAKESEQFDPYCPTCGTCGFLGCCGIRNFLLKHVVGKTNCTNEEQVLNDLIMELNADLDEKEQIEYLRKCPKCNDFKCSGWHEVGRATTLDKMMYNRVYRKSAQKKNQKKQKNSKGLTQ